MSCLHVCVHRQASALQRMREEAEEREADERALKAAAAKAAAAAGMVADNGEGDTNGDNAGGVVVVAAEAHADDPASKDLAIANDTNPDAVHLTTKGFVQLTPYQAQVLCLARVVLREPKVFLFDAVTRHVVVPELRQRLQTMMDKVSELESTIMVSDQVCWWDCRWRYGRTWVQGNVLLLFWRGVSCADT